MTLQYVAAEPTSLRSRQNPPRYVVGEILVLLQIAVTFLVVFPIREVLCRREGVLCSRDQFRRIRDSYRRNQNIYQIYQIPNFNQPNVDHRQCRDYCRMTHIRFRRFVFARAHCSGGTGTELSVGIVPSRTISWEGCRLSV